MFTFKGIVLLSFPISIFFMAVVVVWLMQFFFLARCGGLINSLHDAARENDLEEAKIFLRSGTNVIDRPRGIYGQTALHVASLKNSLQGILNHNLVSISLLIPKMNLCWILFMCLRISCV